VGIWWNPSRIATLGIEWELQLIDSGSRLLRQDAREVIEALVGVGEDTAGARIHHELMQSTVEIVTGDLRHGVGGKEGPCHDNRSTSADHGYARYDAGLRRNTSPQ